MAAWLDGVQFTPTLGGTTDFVVSAAVVGNQTPALAGVTSGRVYKWHAQSADQSQWEDFEGAITGTTVARTTVLYNSSGTGTAAGQSGAGTKINFTTVPTVMCVALKEDMISVEEANNFTAAQKSQLRANMDLMRFNYIINSAMMISQDNGSTAGTSSGYFPVDMFNMFPSAGGTISIAQVASLTPAGSPNRIRATVTAANVTITAGQFAILRTSIEGQRCTDLKLGNAAAKQFVLQFGVKAPAGTYCVAFTNSTVARTYIAEYVISGPQANTDTVVSIPITGDLTGAGWSNGNTIGLMINWCLAAGSTFQTAAGAWTAGNFYGDSNQFNFMGTNGNVFELFDVGLYEGTVAPAFKVPDEITEFDLCLKYYYKLTSTGPVLAQMSAYSSTLATGGVIPFPRPMRVAPTFSIGSAATDFGILIPSAGVALCSAVSANGTTVNYADIRGTVASVMTIGQAVNFVGQNANARLNFDARM